MLDLSRRILTPELMDAPGVGVEELRRSLRFIAWVNRRLNGAGVVVRRLQQWSRRWKRGEVIRILDVATGGGDIPIAIVQWANRAGHDVHVAGIDLHETTLAIARQTSDAAGAEVRDRITLVQGDAKHMPFAARSFDYAITSMFMHHLPDIEAATVLAAMDHVCSRGLIWNDLLRRRRAYWWISLLTAAASPMVKHDARVSVLAGFRRHELLAMRARLDLSYLTYRRHFAHRFTLAGEKPYK